MGSDKWGDYAEIMLALKKNKIDFSVSKNWLFILGREYESNQTEDSVLFFPNQDGMIELKFKGGTLFESSNFIYVLIFKFKG